MRKIERHPDGFSLERVTREKNARLEWEIQNGIGFTDCYSYVFEIIYGETWGVHESQAFLESPSEFLDWLGFEEVEEPMEGDIVAYALETVSGGANMNPDNKYFHSFRPVSAACPPYFVHVGIFTSDGRVVSKFGNQPLYRHDINEVPEEYGNQVYFFRKSKSS